MKELGGILALICGFDMIFGECKEFFAVRSIEKGQKKRTFKYHDNVKVWEKVYD